MYNGPKLFASAGTDGVHGFKTPSARLRRSNRDPGLKSEALNPTYRKPETLLIVTLNPNPKPLFRRWVRSFEASKGSRSGRRRSLVALSQQKETMLQLRIFIKVWSPKPTAAFLILSSFSQPTAHDQDAEQGQLQSEEDSRWYLCKVCGHAVYGRDHHCVRRSVKVAPLNHKSRPGR